jgi:hypothetical protein
MSETVVAVLIGAIVLALVVMPLLRGGGRPPSHAGLQGTGPIDVPEGPDEVAELDLDHAMGRLSDADYEALRRRVKGPHADEPPVPATPAPPASVAAVPDDLEERAEALIARHRDRPTPSCPACGERPEPGARFCSSCGQRLATCQGCGMAVPQEGARFCPGCGIPLRA